MAMNVTQSLNSPNSSHSCGLWVSAPFCLCPLSPDMPAGAANLRGCLRPPLLGAASDAAVPAFPAQAMSCPALGLSTHCRPGTRWALPPPEQTNLSKQMPVTAMMSGAALRRGDNPLPAQRGCCAAPPDPWPVPVRALPKRREQLGGMGKQL